MSGEARLFTVSPTTQTLIRSFRLSKPAPGSSVLIFSIDKNTHEIVPSDKLTFASGKLDELQDELPDNAPRFVLLSYELVHSDGRKSNPLIMINYVPVTANTTLHTLYASAKVWFQEKADIGKVLDMTDLEELNDDFVKSQLLR